MAWDLLIRPAIKIVGSDNQNITSGRIRKLDSDPRMPCVSDSEFVTLESGSAGVWIVSGLAKHLKSDGKIV